MNQPTSERSVGRCPVIGLIRRFKPTWEHLAMAKREVLLAARAAIDTQIELLDEWRARHTQPEPTRSNDADRTGPAGRIGSS